jgi:D-alanine-D-alanine ligase
LTDHRIRIAVLYGGRSAEHDVSVKSGQSIVQNLDPARYDVTPVRITTDGAWLFNDSRPELTVTEAAGRLREVDLVFPAMHGEYGEDGKIQSFLQMIGVPYVGNRVLASAVGMDKEVTKKLLAAEGLAVADSVVLRPGQDSVDPADVAHLGLPLFVKPARAGSSIGISKVTQIDDLAEAVKHAKNVDAKVLIEEAVLGREVDLAVLEHPDGGLEVGPALEIRSDRAFFDYEAKYADPATVFDIPAQLAEEIRDVLEDHALRAFAALDCTGLLRVDFLLRDGVTPVVNEVNTFPGFTAASQFPQMWRAAGVEFPALLDILVATAQR